MRLSVEDTVETTIQWIVTGAGKAARDGLATTVGLGLLVFQHAQVQRRELLQASANALQEVGRALAERGRTIDERLNHFDEGNAARHPF
jgi:hypothetical protein